MVPALSLATASAVVAGVAGWSLHAARPAPAWPACAPPAIATTIAHPPTDDALDALRLAARLGNTDAGVTLVDALLGRYDTGGGAAALVEALQWLERDLDTRPMLDSGLVQRVVLGPCRSDPLLQWHWLCEPGE